MTFPTPLKNIQPKDNNSYCIVPGLINNYFLTANTAKTITFPADANSAKPNYAIITSSAIFYARFDGGTAVVPVADSSDGVGSEITPGGRVIEDLTTMSVIAPADTVLSIAYYF